MKRHKIVARIILLIFSVVNFALAAPLARGIREVHVDVVDVAEDVTIALPKRWNPSDMWWTNAAERTNTPLSLGSLDSDHRLEQELMPHDPRSPMDSNASPQPSLGSTDSDNSHPLPVGSLAPVHDNLPDLNAAQASQEPTDSDNSHPLPVGPPQPAHNNLPLDIDLNDAPQASEEPTDSDNSHSFPVGPPQPAQNNLPLDIDLNGAPQASEEPTDSDNSHPLPVGPLPLAQNNLPLEIDLNSAPQASEGLADSDNSHPLPVGPPPPAQNNLLLGIDLNAPPQTSLESTDGSYFGSHSTGSSTHGSSYHPTGSESSSDVVMSPWTWYELWVISKSPSSSPSHDSNPPPRQGNWHIDLNIPLSSLGQIDDQPPPAPASDPGSSKRPYSPSDDPGPSKRPYRPLDPGPSTSHPPSSPGPLQHESEDFLSQLFRGRLKRRIPLPSLSR